MRPRSKNDGFAFQVPDPHIRTRDSTPQSPSEVSVRVIDATAKFLDLEEQWNALVARSPVTVYQTFEWNSLWWRHFGNRPGQSLNVLVFEQGEELVGIIPLLAEPVRIMGLVAGNRLRFLGSGSIDGGGSIAEYGPSDYLDAIVPEKYEYQVLSAFVKHIAHLPPRFSHIYLSDIPEESLLVRRLASLLSEQGCSVTLSPSDLCPRIRLPKSGELYLRSRKPEVRRRLRQVRASLAKQFSVAGLLSSQEIEAVTSELIRLHQERWNSVGYPGVYSDPRFCRFQSDMALAFAQRKWLWLKTLTCDNKVVAVRLGFRFNGRFYDYMSGFDSTPEVAKLRPGLALLYIMLHEAIDEGISWLDLLRGNEQYKFDFATESRQNWKMEVRISSCGTPSFLFFLIAVRWNKMLSRIQREYNVFRVHMQKYDSTLGALWRYVTFFARRMRMHMRPSGVPVRARVDEENQGKVAS